MKKGCTSPKIIAILGLLLMILGYESEAKEFTLTDRAGQQQVRFESKAPAEDIIGSASAIEGSLTFDPSKPELAKGTVRVKVLSMKTGIKKRDAHMYGKDWLDADKYPNIVFEVAELAKVVKGEKTASKSTYSAIAKGTFYMHGQSVNLEVPVNITYLAESEATKKRAPGDLIAIDGTFQIALKDFDIKGTKGIIGDKVGEKITITIQLFGASGL